MSGARVLTFLILLVLNLPFHEAGYSARASAQSLPSDFNPQQLEMVAGGSARVIRITDGDTVVLDDHRRIRLVGIQAPEIHPNTPADDADPFAQESKDGLQKIILNEEVNLWFGKGDSARKDRYGRVLAQLQRSDGLWVQGEMLHQGLARVYTFPDNRMLSVEMLKLESAARAAGRGLWQTPYYAVRNSQQLDQLRSMAHSFQLVEGVVHSTARLGGYIYLNFDKNYRTDFTIRIAKKAWPRFADNGKDLLFLEGKPVRVRGWLKNHNGPTIDLDHPERLEILEE